jgi:G3E family GTPase
LESQIRNADIVLINKTDLATPEQIEAVRQKIRDLAPKTEIVEAQYASPQSPIEPWLDPLERPARGKLSTADANPYASLTLTKREPITRESLETFLRDLGDTLLRAKGWVTTPHGRFFLDYASDEFRWEPLTEGVRTDDASTPVRLVIIVPEDLEAPVLTKAETLDLKQLVN